QLPRKVPLGGRATRGADRNPSHRKLDTGASLQVERAASADQSQTDGPATPRRSDGRPVDLWPGAHGIAEGPVSCDRDRRKRQAERNQPTLLPPTLLPSRPRNESEVGQQTCGLGRRGWSLS